MPGGVRNDVACLVNHVSLEESGGRILECGPNSLEKSDTVLGNKHLWGGGRMWKIMKEHLKSPEGARENMLRVKASLQG